MYYHLFLMVLSLLAAAVSVSELYKNKSVTPISDIILHIVMILAFVCGILYFLKGSGKQAAIYYQIFMLLIVFANLFHIGIAINSRGFDIAAILLCAKVLILLLMTFWKDLGEKNSWILFSIVLIIDMAYGIIFAPRNTLVFVIAADTLATLVLDGTIGLAIRNKYADKQARGTE